MVLVDITSDYINAETHKPSGCTELLILEEFKPMKTEYGDKFTGKVQPNGTKPEPKLYQMNNTSAKIAKKVLGPDTISWIGKKISLDYVITNISGEMKNVIYVNELRTLTLNQNPTVSPQNPTVTIQTVVAETTNTPEKE